MSIIGRVRNDSCLNPRIDRPFEETPSVPVPVKSDCRSEDRYQTKADCNLDKTQPKFDSLSCRRLRVPENHSLSLPWNKCTPRGFFHSRSITPRSIAKLNAINPRVPVAEVLRCHSFLKLCPACCGFEYSATDTRRTFLFLLLRNFRIAFER